MKKSIKNYWLSFKQTAAVITVAVCFYACRLAGGNNIESVDKAAAWQEHRLKLYNDSIYPIAKASIHNGDMVTRLGTDITSEMIRKMNLKDQSFSHCGIASIEKDTVFIYHAIGGEFNPDQKLKRETLYSFCHPSDNKAIGIFTMKLDEHEKERLLKYVHAAYRQAIPFDMDFDYATDERMYCAEFVAKSYSNALRDSSWLAFTHKQNFLYVSVDNLFLNKRMVMKVQLNY